MRKIDFLCEFPQVFIFQEERHKTNFGGILFLIYIIIMLIISSSYILDFIINDKFEVENLSIQNQTRFEDLEDIDAVDDYNPITEFRISVPVETYFEYFKLLYTDENNISHVTNLNEIYNYPSLKQYDFSGESFGFNFKSRVSGFKAKLLFYCGKDDNCNDYIEFADIYDKEPIYMGFEPLFPKIEHQNPQKPILDEDKFGQYELLYMDIPYTREYDYIYRVTKYKEKKGLSRIFDKLLGLKSEYFTGYLTFEADDDGNQDKIEFDGNYYRPLFVIIIRNPHDTYVEYKRNRKTELDVLSTISALFTPVRLVFSIIYRYYAKKFNNYKIIENILSPKPKPKKLIELKSISEIKDSSLKDLNDDEKQEILIKSEIIEKTEDNNEENNKDKKDSNDNKLALDKKGIILPKYSFVQFLLNNAYCQCCKRRICLREFNKYYQQDIIEICNTINMKYLSVNSLLYNQIMIENLLKDYNWNNSSLNNIKNNELILKLQNLIE